MKLFYLFFTLSVESDREKKFCLLFNHLPFWLFSCLLFVVVLVSNHLMVKTNRNTPLK